MLTDPTVSVIITDITLPASITTISRKNIMQLDIQHVQIKFSSTTSIAPQRIKVATAPFYEVALCSYAIHVTLQSLILAMT